MIISDQNIQFSARHYGLVETQKQRMDETYLNGQLASRERTTSHTRYETFSVSESALNLTKNHPKLQQHNKESQTFEQQPNRVNIANANNAGPNGLPSLLSPNQPLASPGLNSGVNSSASASTNDNVTLSPRLIKMIEAIESLMERMTGKPYTLKVMGYTPESEANSQQAQQTQHTQSNQPVSSLQNGAWDSAVGFANNLSVQMTQGNDGSGRLSAPVSGERTIESQTYREQEVSNFNAQGSVTTADGNTLHFNLNANMARSFESSVYHEQSKGLVLTDPLVVNFGGAPAQLTLEKVAFDLNSDGQADQISFLESGSGFLALDKNQDGQINNGQELFGTQSGNGFKDLAQYDRDQNGWIDENDAIFSQLQIWHKDSNGLEHLTGLLELNIGAIYLQNEETQFSIKDDSNNLLGQVVKSGLFIGEDQKVGSVQQIDLVI